MQSATIYLGNCCPHWSEAPGRLLRNLVHYELPRGDIMEFSGEHLTYCEYQHSFASSFIRSHTGVIDGSVW